MEYFIKCYSYSNKVDFKKKYNVIELHTHQCDKNVDKDTKQLELLYMDRKLLWQLKLNKQLSYGPAIPTPSFIFKTS